MIYYHVCDDRYPHELLCVMDTPSTGMLWTRYTLWIPLYILSVLTEGEAAFQTSQQDLVFLCVADCCVSEG